MEHRITWGGDPEGIYVTTTGVATVEGLDACVQEMLADPRFQPGLHALVDHRQLDWSQMRPEEIKRRVDLIVRDADHFGLARGAMVMGRQVDYGVARIEQSHFEARSELRFKLRVFMSVEEARQWLREAPAPETGSNGS